jgi:hypothetical protein
MIAGLRAFAPAIAFAILAGCGGNSPLPPGPTPDPDPIPKTGLLIGAGDIADCSPAGESGRHAEDSAKLLDKNPAAVVRALGDQAYFSGTAAEFANCYGPRWGRHKGRTRPAAGNHEYITPGAAPYYAYFGAAAGPAGLGYYAYELGNWHIVVLNSNIESGEGSEQLQWLRDDLGQSRAKCTLAYWHHPRFSSGPSGGNVMTEAWRVLYTAGADVVISAHDHLYERFAPQDPEGRLDFQRGITEFVVGTGGAPLYGFVTRHPNSVAQASVYGVLLLTLELGTYSWSFLEAPAETLRDIGRGFCH